MSQLYCNVADMADLANAVYDAIPAALGSVRPALPAVQKISKNLVAYITGMLLTAPYAIEAGDTRAAGLAEAHADAVLKYLNLVSNTDFTAFLKRKLVEWYAAVPKNDSRAAPVEEADEEAPGEGGRGGRNRWPRRLVCIGKPLQPVFEAKEDRQTDVRDEQWQHWIRTGANLNRIGAAFEP